MSSVPPYGRWLPPLAEPPAGAAQPAGGDEPRWPAWTAWVALVTAFGLALFGALVVSTVAALFGADFDDPTPAVTILQTVVQDAAFIGAAALFALRAGPLLPAQFGLVRVRLRTAAKWMAIAYAGYWAFGIAWSQLIDLTEPDRLPDSLGANESTVALVAVCVLVTVVAPIAEEVFFRGYFFGALRSWRGPWPAVVITGAVFGAIHVGSAEPEFLLPLAVLGAALCVVRWRSGSLLPCIALHAMNNALAFGVTEDWTAWQILLLLVGATAVTMLICRPFLAGPERAPQRT